MSNNKTVKHTAKGKRPRSSGNSDQRKKRRASKKEIGSFEDEEQVDFIVNTEEEDISNYGVNYHIITTEPEKLEEGEEEEDEEEGKEMDEKEKGKERGEEGEEEVVHRTVNVGLALGSDKELLSNHSPYSEGNGTNNNNNYEDHMETTGSVTYREKEHTISLPVIEEALPYCTLYPFGVIADNMRKMGIADVKEEHIIRSNLPEGDSRISVDMGLNIDKANSQVPMMGEIYGLHQCKKLLDEVIEIQNLNPNLYTGDKHIGSWLHLYGPEGSGKRSLVISYARQRGYNLMVVNPHMTCPTVIEVLIKCAKYFPACIVFFDHCDVKFTGGSGFPAQDWGAQCIDFMNKYDEDIKSAPIWFILSTEECPLSIAQVFYKKFVERRFAYTKYPDLNERSNLIAGFVKTFWSRGWSPDATSTQNKFLAKIARDHSEKCVPAEIKNYFRKLYHSYLSTLKHRQDFKEFNVDSREIVPTEVYLVTNWPDGTNCLMSNKDPEKRDAYYNGFSNATI